jgi:hypothetical protein
MANLAPKWSTGVIKRGHSPSELAVMDIFMAGGTGKLTEVVRYYLRTGKGLVALIAGHRHVATGEGKTRLLVFSECVT